MAPASDKPLPYPAGASGLDSSKWPLPIPSRRPSPPAPRSHGPQLFRPDSRTAVDFLPLLERAPRDRTRRTPTRPLSPRRLGSGRSAAICLSPGDGSGDKTLDASASRVLEQVRFRALPAPSPGALPPSTGAPPFTPTRTLLRRPRHDPRLPHDACLRLSRRLSWR